MYSVGIDEVGRGCWAGPLVAGAVLLSSDFNPSSIPVKLCDSKKLSKKQRMVANKWIHENAKATGIGWVWPIEIDQIGLTKSVHLAMERAFSQITDDYDEIIIDGNINYFAHNLKSRALIKADDLIVAVSAASIIAKVARDVYMTELSKKYLGYGFEKHVGYGTAAHKSALQLLGVSDIHRRSYKPVIAILDSMPAV